MTAKVRINLVGQIELMTLGLTVQQAEAILKHRKEHGPIADARQLGVILAASRLAESLGNRVDFSPADATAPEAPGA